MSEDGSPCTEAVCGEGGTEGVLSSRSHVVNQGRAGSKGEQVWSEEWKMESWESSGSTGVKNTGLGTLESGHRGREDTQRASKLMLDRTGSKPKQEGNCTREMRKEQVGQCCQGHTVRSENWLGNPAPPPLQEALPWVGVQRRKVRQGSS